MHTPNGEALFLDQLPLIQGVIRGVCRRHRVSPDEEPEFARGRPREIEVAEMMRYRGNRTDAAMVRGELQQGARRVRGVLARVVASLADGDRRLLRLRFRHGQSVADIARATGADQKALYRRLNAILRGMRLAFEAESLTGSAVLPLLGHAEVEMASVLQESTVGHAVAS